MSAYYGTAVATPAGHNPLTSLQHVSAPVLADERWCDEAGCPASQCVHCKTTTNQEN